HARPPKLLAAALPCPAARVGAPLSEARLARGRRHRGAPTTAGPALARERRRLRLYFLSSHGARAPAPRGLRGPARRAGSAAGQPPRADRRRPPARAQLRREPAPLPGEQSFPLPGGR